MTSDLEGLSVYAPLLTPIVLLNEKYTLIRHTLKGNMHVTFITNMLVKQCFVIGATLKRKKNQINAYVIFQSRHMSNCNKISNMLEISIAIVSFRIISYTCKSIMLVVFFICIDYDK